LTLSNSVTNWPPEPNNTVNALVTVGNVVWAGGSFTAVAGLPQAHLARLIPVSGVAAPGPAPAASSDIALEIGPNPTHGALHVRYALASAARVRIGVYDVLGRRLGAEIEQLAAPGAHDITWAGVDGRGHAPAGLYFVRLEAAGRQATRRFVVVR
ncbi:MAG TPA: T9SS type A sorting domain-containing protein, partial [Candidatus Eisenbacteria bacterium]|nr:T9SS type A sorting domain-containing protein [Candidatus Eisenbacteria bacterium]